MPLLRRFLVSSFSFFQCDGRFDALIVFKDTRRPCLFYDNYLRAHVFPLEQRPLKVLFFTGRAFIPSPPRSPPPPPTHQSSVVLLPQPRGESREYLDQSGSARMETRKDIKRHSQQILEHSPEKRRILFKDKVKSKVESASPHLPPPPPSLPQTKYLHFHPLSKKKIKKSAFH